MKVCRFFSNMILLACCCLPFNSFAEFSGDITLVNNYVSRGLTQTRDNAAIQLGMLYSHDSGFYAGSWVSNVDFDTTKDEYELDVYVGHAGELNDIQYDLHFAYYFYPENGNFDYGELGGSLAWQMLTVGIEYSMLSDVGEPGIGIDGDLYYYAGLNYDLQGDLHLGLVAGITQYEDTGGTPDDYTHYDLSLVRNFAEYGDLGLLISKADEGAYQPDGDDKVRFAVYWQKGF